MRLTKEEFVHVIDAFERMVRGSLEITNSLNVDTWEPDIWIEEYYNLIHKLCDVVGDHDHSSDIDYYCYELDFGTLWEPGMIKIDGKDIPCRNAEELWDLIHYNEN